MEREIKYIFYVVGLVIVIFLAGFFVRGCTIDESKYIKACDNYRATIERLTKELADENDTVQRITEELRITTEKFDSLSEFFIEGTKRIEELKKIDSDDAERIDIIKNSVKEIREAVTN